MGKVEIPNWLKVLPLAPEFRPTDTEFADPIAYISKIEKEASSFGICKIIPPLPKPSKRYVFANLNKSLLKCPELGSDINSFAVCNSLKTGSGDAGNEGEMRAVFTTRHQELGSEKRTKGTAQNQLSGVHKQVWQSGEIYTLEQFESKSKAFARSILGTLKDVSPLVIEAMFWKAASEKPIYIEYANDVPGSAFGESSGQFHYIHRRRRKSAYYKRSLDRSDCKKTEMDGLRDSQTDKNKDVSAHAETYLHTSKSTTNLSTFSSIEALHSRQKRSDASNEMEGTAGWKLSNSPWNLQVIARSLGSLTRFMPDDIPGVTSPMVYIGMLFSWFAWHVEDHELHSMNFLHTGSPKTWYAVPGDYALSFEEVIRSEAYGGNIDHLAALTLLGEKTTLLSPEVVVASGIPCCRLIQNPGEFVVTFPRAYHVGFSHGFNCGEAANFGTPEWLKVAKEAAVRRAVMNYLPMLSHQQLLYLLTMSFVSRVPRTLLPGVRSSRLRDRQREERELLVKKAFIEDILEENNLLSGLLENNPNCRAVLWNADLLPDSSRDSQLPDLASTAGTSMADNTAKISSADKNSSYLLDEMSLCMENLTALYHADDDLPSHFQTDSGALACVSCGILGFPFMTVVQPSEKLLMELQAFNHLVQNSSLDPPASMQDSISGLSSTKELPKPSLLQFDRGWNTSCKPFRPRIFCLEHGLQIVKMLQCKGGVNLLVICHSDYQKIKAHAQAVAEEIGSAFDYHEVPLEAASPEDLSLIDMAIDTEEHYDCEEDWTSKLGINLRYCVNARKNPQSKQAPYPLALGMLFPEKGPGSESLSFNWQSRKSRSKKLNKSALAKAHDSMQRKKDDHLEGRIDGSSAKKENLIQYSRRKFKSKETCFSVSRVFHESDEKSKNVSSTLCGNLRNQECKIQLDTQNTGSDCTVSYVSASNGKAQMRPEIQVTEVATSISFNTASSQPSHSFADSAAMDENVTAEVENQIVEELDIDGRNSLATPDHFMMHNKICASEMHSKEDQISHDKEYFSSLTIATDKKIEMRDTSNKCSNSLDLLDKVHQEFQSSNKGSNKEAPSSTLSLLNQPTLASVDGNSESLRKNSGAEGAMSLEETDVLENNTLNGSHKQCIPSYDKPINEHIVNNEAFEAPTELYNAADVHKAAAIDIEEQQETQITKCDNREIDLSTNLSVKQQCVQIGKCAEGLKDEVILESEKQHQIQTKSKINKELAPSHGAKGGNKNVTVPEVACSKVSMKTCPDGDPSSPQYVSDQKEQLEVQPKSINEEELCSGTETSLKESSASIQECSTVEKDTCGGEDLIGTQVHSSKDNREVESCELTTLVPRSNSGKKRRREVEQITKDNSSCQDFVRSPCEGLRPRARKVATGGNENKTSSTVKENRESKRVKRPSGGLPPSKKKNDDAMKSHKCDLDGCRMSFKTKAELLLHKRNRCPHEGCGKKFSSHKYALLHHRVHDDERPLKCPWKGCTMSFKWAWARTEHIRVHTGEKPYKCKVEGCGLSFRFISDYSRHRRKTGHYVNTAA